MPATDPSRKCRFRRSLPHLGTACNLRFFACIHTSAFIKKNLKKTRFDPFSAIWAATEASKAPFFAESHPAHNAYAETRENCPKNDFLAGAKISAARVTYPESSYTSYTFLRKRSKLVRSPIYQSPFYPLLPLLLRRATDRYRRWRNVLQWISKVLFVFLVVIQWSIIHIVNYFHTSSFDRTNG